MLIVHRGDAQAAFAFQPAVTRMAMARRVHPVLSASLDAAHRAYAHSSIAQARSEIS
jgi:hypothetical protein